MLSRFAKTSIAVSLLALAPVVGAAQGDIHDPAFGYTPDHQFSGAPPAAPGKGLDVRARDVEGRRVITNPAFPYGPFGYDPYYQFGSDARMERLRRDGTLRFAPLSPMQQRDVLGIQPGA